MEVSRDLSISLISYHNLFYFYHVCNPATENTGDGAKVTSTAFATEIHHTCTAIAGCLRAITLQ